MKLYRRSIAVALVLAIVFSLCSVTASAASTSAYDCLSDSQYAKAYPINTGTIIPYTDAEFSHRGTVSYGKSSSSYIDGYNDLLYVMDVGTNSRGEAWAKVSYPVGNSKRVIAYIHLSDLTANTHSVKAVSSGKFLCALRQNDSLNSSYYVAANDTVWLLAVSDSRCQILYPTSSGYRIAWCEKADYEKYCGSIPGTGNSSSDMIDVTAYFAGKTIVMQSVENGNYLLPDPMNANAPLCAKYTTWTSLNAFAVEVTADGWAGFKAYDGRYLSATADVTDTPIRAVATRLLSWECFRIYQSLTSGDFYIKAQVNSKWLCVRVDQRYAPTEAYASVASTWERLKIHVVGEEMYISPAEIVRTASENSISPGSNAYKALQSLNSKYASQLSASEEQGTVVAIFEGVGNDASTNKRMNAMALVIRNGGIIYLNRNSSTIPDFPFSPSRNGGTNMPTAKSGVWSFTTKNHKDSYAALNVTNVPVVRHRANKTFYEERSPYINVHRRSYDYLPATGTPNSAGCLLVGKSGTSSSGEYARFIQALGIVASNASGNAKYATQVNGRIIIDRTFAYSYLKNIGYSDAAIQLIG